MTRFFSIVHLQITASLESLRYYATSSTFFRLLALTPADPPHILIDCVFNCAEFINPTELLKLSVSRSDVFLFKLAMSRSDVVCASCS